MLGTLPIEDRSLGLPSVTTHQVRGVQAKSKCGMQEDADLDDGLAAGLEEATDGPEVGWQILMANRLYHLAAHHLRM